MARYCDRGAPLFLMSFLICLFLFFVSLWIILTQSEFYGTIVINRVIVVGILSCLAYPWALFLRDAILKGRKSWRFSLRALLITTTLVAVVLGLIIVLNG
jgi:hypothetical protein